MANLMANKRPRLLSKEEKKTYQDCLGKQRELTSSRPLHRFPRSSLSKSDVTGSKTNGVLILSLNRNIDLVRRILGNTIMYIHISLYYTLRRSFSPTFTFLK